MDSLKQIVLNQYVLIRSPINSLKIIQLKPNGVVSLGKFGAFEVNEIIGYKLGSTFEIWYDGTESKMVQGSKTLIGKTRLLENINFSNELDSVSTQLENPQLVNIKNSENNKNLIDNGHKTQKMTMEEIESLKQNTASSNEIISKMIESHENFHKKTIQSQEKYLKRKKQKFSRFFTVEYLSSSGMLKYLVDKGDTMKIMDLTEESIGLILNLGNINSNGNYLCVDQTGGLIVYSMLERMFGGCETLDKKGRIIVVHENDQANLDLLKYSNYSDEFIAKHVKTISILDYFEPPTLEEVKNALVPLNENQNEELKNDKRSGYCRRLKWYQNQVEIIELTTNLEYDGLIVSTTLQLTSLIHRLGERIHGSRPIVCYSQFREPLLELAHFLYDDMRFLAPTLRKTRCRPFQTVRGKLHPVMTMRGGGGYVLWCHRVIQAEEPPIHHIDTISM